MINYSEIWGYLLKVCDYFIPPGNVVAKIRGFLYKPFFRNCGNNLKIAERAYIYNPNTITLGENVWLGYNCYLGKGFIVIGHNVVVGPFVSVSPTNHIRKNESYRFSGSTNTKIKIGNNVWIGAHSCILASVSINNSSVIAAGAVVTKDIPSCVMVSGIPAKINKKYSN